MLQTIQSGFYPLTGDFILRFGTVTAIIMGRSPPQIDLRTFLKEFFSTYDPALNEPRLLVEHNIYTIIINTYFIRFLLYSQFSAISCFSSTGGFTFPSCKVNCSHAISNPLGAHITSFFK